MRATSVLVCIVGVALATAHGAESQAPASAWSGWSEPVNLGAINSPFIEQNPFLAKDELALYFASNRPGGHGDRDIWVARRSSRDSDWEPAVNLGPVINTGAAEIAPNLSIDGHLLFFGSNRSGGQGGFDIYVSRRFDTHDDSGWTAPIGLPPPINTADTELAPFYLQNAEDGSANLYFNRGNQALQLSDIYYAPIGRDGEPRGAEVWVAELNSPMNEAAVTVRKDGREVFFWSQREGSAGGVDIWTSHRPTIHEPWSTPTNVGEPISSAFVETTPNLSFDRATLIFSSNRPGGSGGLDFWMSIRTRGGQQASDVVAVGDLREESRQQRALEGRSRAPRQE